MDKNLKSGVNFFFLIFHSVGTSCLKDPIVLGTCISIFLSRRGVLLCKDSNSTDWIYVIKTGTCRVLKDLFETKPNIRGLEVIPYTPQQTYVSKYYFNLT